MTFLLIRICVEKKSRKNCISANRTAALYRGFFRFYPRCASRKFFFYFINGKHWRKNGKTDNATLRVQTVKTEKSTVKRFGNSVFSPFFLQCKTPTVRIRYGNVSYSIDALYNINYIDFFVVLIIKKLGHREIFFFAERAPWTQKGWEPLIYSVSCQNETFFICFLFFLLWFIFEQIRQDTFKSIYSKVLSCTFLYNN